MIRTLLRIGFINLRRDRPAQIFAFVVPISFFTIFAMVFGGRGRDVTPRVPVAVVDEARSATSARLVRALKAEKGLRARTTYRAGAGDTTQTPIDRARAERLVRDGAFPAAIVIPAGIDSSIGRYDGRGDSILVLTDPSDPVAPQVVAGLLQRDVMMSAPASLAKHGIDQLDRWGGGLTPRQREATSAWITMLQSDSASGTSDSSSSAGMRSMVKIRTQEVLGRKEDTSMIAFYAAGIAVMFLLFTCSGAAGSLIEEVESGTLERVLTSRVGMNGLLVGKWLYLTLLGMLGVTVMFVYGMLFFRLDLLHHVPGFLVMTAATTATAGAFGLMLATICRTRQQLGGISTLLILTLSALGGSMFPRFLMTPEMQRLGLFTFNAWALDGYVKVFWRDAPLTDLAPQLAVLLGFLMLFAGLARLFARRWESA